MTTPYRFGRFELRPDERQLLADGRPVALGQRAFDVLDALIARRERLVAKNELLDLVWPGLVVEENNLQVQISALRKLLGPQAIATIPGRGYRFAARLDDGAARDAATAAPVATPEALKSNLPERLPPLLGRDDDLAALRNLVVEHPLVTVSGSGGIGKTLLAQHLLQHRRDGLAQGVCWVELAPLADAAMLAPTIAGALGLVLGPGAPAAALVAACAPFTLLLALDNAEHLVAAVATLAADLLAMAPGVRLLVTSQVPLKLPQERLYRLGPLDVPDHDVSADEALSYGAVALFSERAQSADRHFRLTDDNAAAVIALCRQLDGSALAIELAAARVALLGLHQLTESLDQRLSLLTKGNRSAPRRQQTLRAALEWSHDGLSAAERVVFRRLAVTVDSATLELIQEVAADDSIDRWQVLDALDALVDRSLVAVVPCEPPRYRLLESPRALALERLAASGEGEALRQRHARALTALLVAAKTRAPGLPSDRVLAELEPDLGNARAALGWARQHDPAAAVGLAPGMAIMLGQHRYDEQMAMWRATEACLSDELTPALRASWARSAAGFWANRHPKEGRDWARHAVALYRDLDDAMGLYLSLCVLAQSRLADAGDEPREALNELRRLERPDWPAGVRFFGTQADLFVTYYSEDWTGAEAAVRKALALGELGGNSSSSLVARTNLVDLTLIRGDAPEAVRLGHALVQDLLPSRWVNHVNFARVNLAKALLACDDVAQARATALAAWPTASRYDLQLFWLDVLTLLAALEGRWHTAARLHGFAALGYAENHEKRRVGEAQAAMRAEQLTRATLGDETFERLSVEGRGMNGAQIGDIALDRADSLGEARARVPPAAAPPRTD